MESKIQIDQKFDYLLSKLEFIDKIGPSAKAIAGSYGNPNKTPGVYSDLDILYVFDLNNILEILNFVLLNLKKSTDLKVLYLNVHPQFGHLINIYESKNPLTWIDIGIMDTLFSKNYLTGLPKTDLLGDICTTGIMPPIENEIRHLIKKIIKAKVEKQVVPLFSYCTRYLQLCNIKWDNINLSDNSTLDDIYKIVITHAKSYNNIAIDNLFNNYYNSKNNGT